MLIESVSFLSLEEYIENFCYEKRRGIACVRAAGSRIIKAIAASELCSDLKCFTARSANGRQHILFELDFLNDIFIIERSLQDLFQPKLFKARYHAVASKTFYDLSSACCCKEDRLKKVWKRVMDANETIDIGPRMLREFDSIRNSVELILSLDIEMFEQNQSKVLEIGFVAYYPKTERLHAAHCIIRENAHLRNGKYVADRRDHFNLGKSMVLSLNEALDLLKNTLDAHKTACLLGHSLDSDIRFLKPFLTLPAHLHIFDTQTAFRQLTLSSDSSRLEALLLHYDIEHSNLHNAANDAYYTMLAFFKMTGMPQPAVNLLYSQ